MTGCANDRRCAGRTTAGPATAGPRCPLCDPCIDATARDIRALVYDYRDLAQQLAPGVKDRDTVAGGDDDSVPLDLSVDELMRDIAWTLTVWEPPVREAAGLSTERVRGVRPGYAVATAAAVIAPRVQVLAALPPTWGRADGLAGGIVERDGVYAAESLRALHRRAVAALGLTRLTVRLPGPCSACGALWLERRNGDDGARCPACRCYWSADDYRKYVGLQLTARSHAA